LDVVIWLRQQGCAWSPKVLSCAMQGGNIEVLRWARENGGDAPQYLNRDVAMKAAKTGHLVILQKAWDLPIWSSFARWRIFDEARIGGHVEVVEWLWQVCSDNDKSKICFSAANEGHLELLKWARERGCSWDKRVCFTAAGRGDLEMLQWARENGCRWCTKTCLWAARNGHLQVLRWAVENGCPINWDACISAASSYPTSVQRWLVQQKNRGGRRVVKSSWSPKDTLIINERMTMITLQPRDPLGKFIQEEDREDIVEEGRFSLGSSSEVRAKIDFQNDGLEVIVQHHIYPIDRSAVATRGYAFIV